METASEQIPQKHICLGLLAHVDAGKTTLSEGLLYTGGTIRKIGRVDKQDAYLDMFAYERERGITILSKNTAVMYKGTKTDNLSNYQKTIVLL